ncbi:MAG: GNAT family N-acetyltransferase [Bacteroidota bacterium]
MQIRRHLTPGHFLHHNQAFLEQEEAANNLILGLVDRYVQKADFKPDDCLLYDFNVEDDPRFCAIQTPGRNLILYGQTEWCAQWMFLVALNFKGLHPDLPGVFGPTAQAKAFAEHWGGESEVRIEMAGWELREVQDPRPASGKFRKIGPEDDAQVVEWCLAFSEEAMGRTASADDWAKQVAAGRDRIYVWEDGEVVSMAFGRRHSRNMRNIGYVYTPPDRRGKGYASNLVAEMSKTFLTEGKQACTLFTNLANPTSNKIYRALGYTEVCTFSEIAFT